MGMSAWEHGQFGSRWGLQLSSPGTAPSRAKACRVEQTIVGVHPLEMLLANLRPRTEGLCSALRLPDTALSCLASFVI